MRRTVVAIGRLLSRNAWDIVSTGFAAAISAGATVYAVTTSDWRIGVVGGVTAAALALGFRVIRHERELGSTSDLRADALQTAAAAAGNYVNEQIDCGGRGLPLCFFSIRQWAKAAEEGRLVTEFLRAELRSVYTKLMARSRDLDATAQEHDLPLEARRDLRGLRNDARWIADEVREIAELRLAYIQRRGMADAPAAEATLRARAIDLGDRLVKAVHHADALARRAFEARPLK
jgi:hypothetical protein